MKLRPGPRLAVGVGLLAASLLLSVAPASASTVQEAPATSVVSRAATPAQSDSILRLYRAYFLRDPDAKGHAHWNSQYSSGSMSLAAISQYFARSPEFQERYGSLSNAQFTDLIYSNVLGRKADENGQSYWVRRLNQGSSRGAMMIGFSESPEFQKKTKTLPPSSLAAWERELLALTNKHRTANGLQALSYCTRLASAAQGHSNWQARNRVMSHTGANGSTHSQRISATGYVWSWTGENIASGSATYTPADIINAWMDSQSHRANMLSGNFSHVGFGRAVGSDGLVYWTQNFASGGAC